MIFVDFLLFFLYYLIMKNIKEIVSRNLTKLRLSAKMTQLELAEKLQYSDKSISKWERGESLPDFEVMVKLSKIFDVSLNTFIEENEKKVTPFKLKKNSRTIISLLSAGLVFLVASIIFVVLFMIPATKTICWLPFIYSIPISSIILLILASIWKSNFLQSLFSSTILWGIILSLIATINYSELWSLCIIGFVVQFLIIFWFILRKINFKQKLIELKNRIKKK